MKKDTDYQAVPDVLTRDSPYRQEPPMTAFVTHPRPIEIRLSECPFCGNPARIFECTKELIPYSSGGFYAFCDNCEISMGRYDNKFGGESGVYKSEYEALNAWNARSLPTGAINNAICALELVADLGVSEASVARARSDQEALRKLIAN